MKTKRSTTRLDSPEWLRRAQWCEHFEKDHPTHAAGLKPLYGAISMYMDYVETNEKYEMAYELHLVAAMKYLGKKLHYQLK